MGVYQSVTEPKIICKNYKSVILESLFTDYGKKHVINIARRTHHIPRKTQPEITMLGNGMVELYFEWYEVQTFN